MYKLVCPWNKTFSSISYNKIVYSYTHCTLQRKMVFGSFLIWERGHVLSYQDSHHTAVVLLLFLITFACTLLVKLSALHSIRHTSAVLLLLASPWSCLSIMFIWECFCSVWIGLSDLKSKLVNQCIIVLRLLSVIRSISFTIYIITFDSFFFR